MWFRSVSSVALLALAGCGAVGVSSPPPEPSEPVAQHETKPSALPQYLVLGPREFEKQLAPLLAFRAGQGLSVEFRAVESIFERRSRGEESADALRAEVEAEAQAPGSRLHYVVLAGDPQRGVPTFTRKAEPWASSLGGDATYPSDHDYAASRIRRLSVGRLPARSQGEMSLLVDKTLRYESSEVAGAWQRRVLVFGGPADFGPVADGLIEAQATSLLDQVLPYDYDVGVLFAKKDSPYAFRFDQLGRELVREVNRGALVAVYAGHGRERSFDQARFRGHRYDIGDVRDLADIDIDAGSPLFISLTCLTGDFGMPNGERSVGETMMLRPRGPIAVFASSGVSHPYPNLLYARALLGALFTDRGSTLGDAVLRAKKDMTEASIPFASLLVPGDHDAIKASHLYLYNLLGDPALKLRLPEPLAVTIDQSSVAPGATVSVTVEGPSAEADVLATLETERVVLKPGITLPDALDAMPVDGAFAAMEKNHAIANDKIATRKTARLLGGRVTIAFQAPSSPGRYVIKVLSSGERSTAAGHVRLDVQ